MRPLVASICLAIVVSVPAEAQFDGMPNPRIWTWRQPPAGLSLSRVEDGTIAAILVVDTGPSCQVGGVDCCDLECGCESRTPEAAVSSLAASYQQNPALFGDEPAICLQTLGMGDWDPCPGIAGLSSVRYAPAHLLRGQRAHVRGDEVGH